MALARSPRGFTLLELLCVLGLVAAMLAIAVPQVSAANRGLTLDQGARRIASELQLCRWKAIARNTRVRLIVDVAEPAYRVEAESEGSFVADGDRRRLPPGVRVDEAASTRVRSGSVTITFQPRGNTADNATIALLSPPDLRRSVVVSLSGRIRTQ